MNVVVTGAIGFVGTPLVRALLAAGRMVTACTRDAQRAVRRLPAGCTVESWSPAQALDPSTLRGAGGIVVHLVGEDIPGARWTAARKRAIRDSRVNISLALVRAIGQLDAHVRPRVLVSASAIGWYGATSKRYSSFADSEYRS